jgi:hypothetical protein
MSAEQQLFAENTQFLLDNGYPVDDIWTESELRAKNLWDITIQELMVAQ